MALEAKKNHAGLFKKKKKHWKTGMIWTLFPYMFAVNADSQWKGTLRANVRPAAFLSKNSMNFDPESINLDYSQAGGIWPLSIAGWKRFLYEDADI